MNSGSIGDFSANVRDIYAETVIFSQKEKIEAETLKVLADDNEELSRQEKEELKRRIDVLKEEIDEKNEDAILKTLEMAKKAGGLFWPMIKFVVQLL